MSPELARGLRLGYWALGGWCALVALFCDALAGHPWMYAVDAAALTYFTRRLFRLLHTRP